MADDKTLQRPGFVSDTREAPGEYTYEDNIDDGGGGGSSDDSGGSSSGDGPSDDLDPAPDPPADVDPSDVHDDLTGGSDSSSGNRSSSDLGGGGPEGGASSRYGEMDTPSEPDPDPVESGGDSDYLGAGGFAGTARGRGPTDAGEVGRDPENIEPADRPEPDPEQGLEAGGDGVPDPVADQAEQLEDQAIEQASEQGIDFEDEDVRVEREQRDGETVLRTELTETGQTELEREQFQREFQARRDVIVAADQQTEADLTVGSDFTVERTEDGFDVDLTESGVAKEVEAQTGGEAGEDFTVVEGADGSYEVEAAGPSEAAQRQMDRYRNRGRSQAMAGDVIQRRVPDEGDVLAGTTGAVEDAGRTLLGEERADREIASELTEGDGSLPFTLTEGERAEVKQDIRQRRRALDVSDEAESFVQGVTGSGTAASVAAGLGRVPGDFASATAGATLLADTGVRTAANLPETVGKYGAAATGETIANAVTSSARGSVEQFAENPAEVGGQIAGGFVAGGAVTRTARAGRTAARSTRVRTKADSSVDYEDITTDRGAEGDLPEFDTDPEAPTREAVDEVSERARDNPDAAAPGDAEGAVYHTTDQDVTDFGDEMGSQGFETGEGRSELPGMFTSPEASPIGLDRRARSSYIRSLANPGLPRARGGRSDQVVSLPGDDVRGFPDDATGAGYELRDSSGEPVSRGLGRGEAKSLAEGTDLEVAPQSNTGGYQYLTEEAEAGTVNVRPQGARTTELEGIVPPGTRYVEEGTTAVRMPGRTIPGTDRQIPGTGRTIPMRRFREVDSDGDLDGAGSSTTTADADAGAGDDTVGVVSSSDLPSSRSSDFDPAREAVGGGYIGAGATSAGGDRSATTTRTTTTADTTTSAVPTDITAETAVSSGGASTTDLTTSTTASATDTGTPTGGPSGTGGGSSTTPPSTTLGGGSSTGGSSTGSGSSTPGSGTSTPYTPGSGTPSRPPRPPRDTDPEEEMLGASSGDAEATVKRFQYGVADPDEVLTGDISGDGDDDVLDDTGPV